MRFGENFFKSFQSSFSPISIPNVTDDYIVDVGDIFEVLLVGQVTDRIPDVPVAVDGTMTINGLGKFRVAGLSLSEVSRLINKYVENKIVG